ncbi:MAG: hypothetical protein OXD47_02035 [Gammaproteobacteria bacterium]|nr:hypothetical protein [Gammaproteobacteria bacterium]MCY4282633.1 hypothetical protein [Gammaproteobacteria bacterium]MCY4337561.1 hypothetical protein [Gammaproteobacteria bacterium]
MSTIDLYNVLRRIPEVSEQEARAAAEESSRQDKDIAELKVGQRWIIAILLLLVSLELVPYFAAG